MIMYDFFWFCKNKPYLKALIQSTVYNCYLSRYDKSHRLRLRIITNKYWVGEQWSFSNSNENINQLTEWSTNLKQLQWIKEDSQKR